MSLMLSRHPWSLHNGDYLDNHRVDVGVHPLGYEQTSKLVGFLIENNICPSVIVSSEATRTAEPAEIIAKMFNAKHDVRPEAREFHWGDFAGRPKTDLFPKHGVSIADRLGWDFRPEGAPESRRQAGMRIAGMYDELERRYPHEVVLVISHGMVARCGLGYKSRERLFSRVLQIPFPNGCLLDYVPALPVAAYQPRFVQ